MNRIIINKELVSQTMGKKIIIFDGEKSLLFTLNGTGAVIFNKLQKGLNTQEIKSYLQKKYGLTKVQAKRDVDNFISVLLKKKIIKISNTS
ncbi:hypothetical protein A3J20_01695 [Candidatus Gottesmanbacteria bacterium RIFCSPLOWO2_02_FULL_42_29]|uniref:PqqD family protein n=2 Tax=Candidatus Gottesmaniibacteriota TaxID=1752720 RepID=A0A1F6BB75_9BACT|nr:MAG: hypothetical protein UV09_C0018G0003 [Candidatus Gottesmanbacteria bacterium GW2011_GWA2_42_18]OGG10755.1 MAG: hypothetical protein A2781_03790 [Candidatus Gottesmanbacteria bacterium RIFCSPHIGHO2_01_FULL_42_27]OGG21918.1 MAG: hypothetical protein A3E72_01725 [Candidatus Gottesmanbacteria bacterium RIFCSPHIGHO2_12_FULL_43_26]OGG34186.1 MAG: hypothetical protein A2968_03360 [Candidatus Gottesmanbacteria bacterium RIFCSPLOWO2_01_FULL_42_22]OGG35940.1 MAG: hypothetical protein A3G68_07375 